MTPYQCASQFDSDPSLRFFLLLRSYNYTPRRRIHLRRMVPLMAAAPLHPTAAVFTPSLFPTQRHPRPTSSQPWTFPRATVGSARCVEPRERTIRHHPQPAPHSPLPFCPSSHCHQPLQVSPLLRIATLRSAAVAAATNRIQIAAACHPSNRGRSGRC